MTLPNLPFELSTTLIEQLGDDAHTVEEQYSKLFEWMIQKGKNPRRMKGINKSTADDYIQRLDQLHRFLLQYLDPEDPTKIRDNQADKLLRLIDRGEITQYQGRSNGEEYNESSKRKFANALEMYFKWLYYSEEAIEYEWESKIDFSNGKTNPADTFTYREIGLLFREAESYGKLPSYYDTPAEKRDKIDALVAQRLGLPKDEVTQEDWLQADWSAKFSSLMLVGYDAGLTPKEVENMKVHWYDPQQKILRIPSEKACKEREKEAVGLSDQGADALEKWLQERRHRSKYDGTDRVWLNRVGSAYKSGSLCNLIRKLCRQAGINISDRKIVWYSLRKSMGTYVTDEGDITEANDQLRHQRLETTPSVLV